MEVRPLVFADDAEGKPRLYACGKCGNATSPRHFGGGEVGHAEARTRAEVCCTPPPPPTVRHCACGAVLHGSFEKECYACHDKMVIAKATIVEDDGEPICIVGTDTFFSDLVSASEEHAGRWAHPCERQPLHINAKSLAESLAERAVEDMCEEAFEDAEDSVNGVTALTETFEAALTTFNNAQTASSWSPDTTKIVRVPGEPEAA
jgi:hypothetical protein